MKYFGKTRTTTDTCIIVYLHSVDRVKIWIIDGVGVGGVCGWAAFAIVLLYYID
jgi:hypothetical protein